MNIMCWSLLWAFLANKNDLTLHPRLSQSQFMFCRTGSRCWPSYLVRWVMKCYPDLKPSMNSPASGRCPITTFYWWYAYHPQILVVGNWFTTNYGHLWPILIHQLTDIRDPHIGPFDRKASAATPVDWGSVAMARGWEVACQHIFNYQQLHFESPHMFHCM